MSEKILVPVLGESITEATVAKWLKKKGESINADEPIVELETDKVNLEVPSPINGVLAEINCNNGDTVAVGAVLGTVTEGIGETVKIEKKNRKSGEQNQANNVINLEQEKKQEPRIFEDKKNDSDERPLILKDEQPFILSNAVVKKSNQSKKQALSPAVRKIVEENKINLDLVQGTGKDGRILKGDLINLMGASPKPSERKIKYGQEERIKMTRLRQTIAKRLKEAQENAAMLTTFNEVDMSKIITMRKENQEDFQTRFGIKLGFMSFFVKACVLGLKIGRAHV